MLSTFHLVLKFAPRTQFDFITPSRARAIRESQRDSVPEPQDCEARATPGSPSAKPPQPQRGCAPSIPARAHDELLLHMQQSFAQGYSGFNVRSCRPASRSTSTRRRHACCPGKRTAESGPAAADRSSPRPATPRAPPTPSATTPLASCRPSTTQVRVCLFPLVRPVQTRNRRSCSPCHSGRSGVAGRPRGTGWCRSRRGSSGDSSRSARADGRWRRVCR